MERSEPTLVPEWLKNTGNVTGGGSISHSDDHAASRVARNKSFVNSNGHEFGRSSSSERTTSSYFRRSSSSNSSGNFRSYSSFGRSQRDRDWEKDVYDSRDQDKSVLGDHWHRDFSDPLSNSLLSKYERDGLRRSQSMVSGKRGDTWPKKVVTDLSSASGKNANGLLSKGSPVGGRAKKATFEKDFPSLGADERVVVPEVGRVPSPGLSTAIQSLPVGTSGLIVGEKWTSALAEVPVLVGSNGTALSSVQQAAPSSSASVALGSTTSLNMAEAVAQGPTRTQTTPQLSVGNQRLEELAIKQSRQLIPVTPSMPKALILKPGRPMKFGIEHVMEGDMGIELLSSSLPNLASSHFYMLLEYIGVCYVIEVDYERIRLLTQCDIGSAYTMWFMVLTSSDKPKGKVPQHSISSSLPLNHSPRGGVVKGDIAKASTNVGKLQVLKPVREKNGVTPVVKDNLSPTSSSKVVTSTLAASPSVSGSAATKGLPNNGVHDRKPSLTVLEKRPTSQAQSRNDFFNLVRKKSMPNSSSAAAADSSMARSSSVLDTGTAISPSFSDKDAEIDILPTSNTPKAADVPLSNSLSVDHLSEEKADLTSNGDAQNYVRNGKKHPSSDPIISEEEEAAFLRSLGWDENSDEGCSY
ncbi:UNVERIFIED_CONTAM: hypothetical protein Sradi_4730000 [Sesamum radiatum]|uniref:Uncharacterized protein n=1 Tax=Sesamum radiatum TaxID=300843 RepID=A0AAW2MXE6_SESRA